MSFDPERHHRQSIRLRGYDYAQGRAHFVTICVLRRVCALGEVADRSVRLSEAGAVVAQCWAGLPQHFPTVELDAYVIMPNHFHAIIPLTASRTSDAGRAPLSRVVGALKAFSARGINGLRSATGAFWQRGYYEHVIRDERSLLRLQTYVAQNPARWEFDRLHPDSTNPW